MGSACGRAARWAGALMASQVVVRMVEMGGFVSECYAGAGSWAAGALGPRFRDGPDTTPRRRRPMPTRWLMCFERASSCQNCALGSPGACKWASGEIG
jgi:hypothetical protein